MNSKDIIIFTGPSINHKEAHRILEATYKPPVKRGDILKIINTHPKIIGIIDGVFHQQPAVAHKEIMKALKEDIIVVGGASMGALRASELDSLGMIGIGSIYQKYASGEIESDDDVAVIFDPDTYEQLNESLVNIKYNLQKAQNKKIITKTEYREMISIAKETYYPYRTYKKIFKNTTLSDETIKDLNNFLDKCDDIKYNDAVSVLEYIKNITTQWEG